MGFRARIVKQIFLERKHRIGLTEFLNETRFGQIHEVFARAAQTVTGRTETGDMAAFGNIENDFIECAGVPQVELSGAVAVARRIRISTGIGAGACADLGHAVVKNF